jgi:hypothetical protein
MPAKIAGSAVGLPLQPPGQPRRAPVMLDGMVIDQAWTAYPENSLHVHDRQRLLQAL